MSTSSVPKLPTIAPVQFLKEVVSELRKVTWPSRAETIKLTAVVIAISLIVGLFIGGLDIALIKLTTLFFSQ